MRIRTGFYCIAGGLGTAALGILGLTTSSADYEAAKAQIPERFFEVRDRLEGYEREDFRESLRNIMSDQDKLAAYQELSAEYQTFDLSKISALEKEINQDIMPMMIFSGAVAFSGALLGIFGINGIMNNFEERSKKEFERRRM